MKCLDEKINILLIIVDTTRKDHLGCYGYPRDTSPTIDRLAKEGTIFTNCYASDVPTIPSYTAVLTGQRGTSTTVISNDCWEISSQVTTFPAVLSEKGILTCAVSSLAEWKYWFTRGFRHYINPVAGQDRTQLVTAEEINSYAMPLIRMHKNEQFFLFVHYWDPHWPYWPPKKYREMFGNGENLNLDDPSVLTRNRGAPNPVFEQMKARSLGRVDPRPVPGPYREDDRYTTCLYDGEIRYTDDSIRQLLAVLEEEGVREKTIIILTADHGEHDTRNHGELYEPIINIPLIVSLPEEESMVKKVDALVQNIDITPTILEAFGVMNEAEWFEGRSLFPLLKGETDKGYEAIHTWMANARTMRVGKWKYIENFVGPLKPPQELYNLTEDPMENRNLAEEEPHTAKSMQQQMADWMKSELDSKPDPIRLLSEIRKREAARQEARISDYGIRRRAIHRAKYHDSPYLYPFTGST